MPNSELISVGSKEVDKGNAPRTDSVKDDGDPEPLLPSDGGFITEWEDSEQQSFGEDVMAESHVAPVQYMSDWPQDKP